MDDSLDMQRKSCEEEIQKCVESSLSAITERMHHIGLNGHSDAVEWFTVIKTEVATLMTLLVTESEERERVIMDDIIDLLKRAQEYCQALRIPMEAHGENGERCLIEEKILLKKRLEEYEIMLQAKQKELKVLQKRNIVVSQVLNMEPLNMEYKVIPSEKEFQEILLEIEKREMKRFELEETLFKTKEKILKLVHEFELHPTSEFQKMVINKSVETFVLSEKNMKLLEEYFNFLTLQSNSNIEKVTELRLKVRSLWDMLSEDIQQCDEFIRQHPGSSQSTLEAFRNELHRCEELRKANIGKFVEKLRSDISTMWDNCHFSQEDRENFKYFKDTFYNEDLLELHERELEQLQHIYNEDKNILSYLEEHEDLWKKLEKLDEHSCNPSRLFNRGGQLLKEEKERNVVQRKLPKIDAGLIELAEIYETTHGKPFRSYGRTVQEIIDEKYENREKEKQLKLSARKIKNTDLTPGKSSSTMNLARSRWTPETRSTTKRRILSPRNATTSKKIRVAAVHKRNIQNIPIIKINSKTLEKSVRTAESNRRKRLEKSRRLSDFLNQKEDQAYNEFSVQLCKSNLRSTLLVSENEEVLAVPLPKTPSNPSRKKSPHATPQNKSAYKLTVASNKKIIL